MQPTWILVADGVRARLFADGNAAAGDGKGALIEVQDFFNADGRKPGLAFTRDRPPRTMESASSTRHAIEPHTNAEDKVAQRFARELSDALERGRVEHRYQRLLLVAPPHFLGTLQQALGKHVQACISGHLGKDLTTQTPAQIRSQCDPLLKEAIG